MPIINATLYIHAIILTAISLLILLLSYQIAARRPSSPEDSMNMWVIVVRFDDSSFGHIARSYVTNINRIFVVDCVST
ncbi:hypothetical protein FRB91_005819 [Serendipita sp. 411]|nr:hypothetical protein FRB91_005819 [Serendipita sp. 411]